MRSKLWQLAFGEHSLLKQAYFQFFISIAGALVFFFLPERWRILVIGWLSWWAITITAQSFIAASHANRKVAEIQAEQAEVRAKEAEINIED